MLPTKKIRGKEALKRVHVYIGEIPDRFQKRYQTLIPTDIPNSEKNRLSYYNKFITLENLCTRIGWNKLEIEA